MIAVVTGAARVETRLGPIGIWVNNALAAIFCAFDVVAT